jgi:hypothetical protein
VEGPSSTPRLMAVVSADGLPHRTLPLDSPFVTLSYHICASCVLQGGGLSFSFISFAFMMPYSEIHFYLAYCKPSQPFVKFTLNLVRLAPVFFRHGPPVLGNHAPSGTHAPRPPCSSLTQPRNQPLLPGAALRGDRIFALARCACRTVSLSFSGQT